ncbi:MAG: sulfite exporter TauE/SafE family protein [Candidatus Aminicenantes bacterium]|jgi:hypothetical protein
MQILNLFLLFGIGIVVGFVNVNAGGGSSLTLPTLIFMLGDGALANGTNRVAIFFQNLFAVASFKKREFHEFRLSGKLSLLTLPGAIIGSILATRISSVLFERILGGVLIFIVISMFITRSYGNGNKDQDQERHKNWLIYPALVGIGFYGGFLQIGVGFLFMAALYHLFKLDLIRVNMHKVFIILVYTVPAMIIFLVTGNINWKFGLSLAAGSAIGAWFGARVSVKGGEKVIRIILAVAILFMAAKLFGLF